MTEFTNDRLERMLHKCVDQRDVLPEGHPIVPIMLGEAAPAVRLAEALLEQGVDLSICSDPALAELLQKFLERRLQDLGDIIKRAVRSELSKRDQSLRENERMRSLAEKSFYYLSEDEIRRMKEAVAKLAQRLKNVVAIRRRRACTGTGGMNDPSELAWSLMTP